jgi:cytochrome b561
MQKEIFDTPVRYGVVSRALHGVMAFLFGWIFITGAGHMLAKEAALSKLLWLSHKPVGLLLMSLVILRITWALVNAGRRPAAVSLFAALGHFVIYALMIAIPLVGLLRQYGSGREFMAFGLKIMNGSMDGKIEWMIKSATFHGEAAWALLALVVGHVVMAVTPHRGNQRVLSRMR